MAHQRLFVINGLITVRLVPELATEVGLHESLILLQVDYLLSVRGMSHVDPKHPEILWINDSLRSLHQTFFPFWSVSTIGQTIADMITNGFLLVWIPEDPKDQSRWITLGPECASLQSVVLMDSSSVRSKPAPSKKVEKKSEPVQASTFELAQALATVTKTDFEMNKGRMLKEAKTFKEHTPSEIIGFFGPGSAWYRIDWRGKQGQPPTVAQVKSEWLKMAGTTSSSTPARSVVTKEGALNI